MFDSHRNLNMHDHHIHILRVIAIQIQSNFFSQATSRVSTLCLVYEYCVINICALCCFWLLLGKHCCVHHLNNNCRVILSLIALSYLSSTLPFAKKISIRFIFVQAFGLFVFV